MGNIEVGSKEFIEKNKKEVLQLLSTVKRDGIQDLIQFLEASTFFSDPASSRYHCNCPRRFGIS